MKKEILKQLIKEEIRKVIAEENDQNGAKKDPAEVAKIKTYLEGTGKASLLAIDNKKELKAIFNLIYAGLKDGMKKNNQVANVFKIANSKLS